MDKGGLFGDHVSDTEKRNKPCPCARLWPRIDGQCSPRSSVRHQQSGYSSQLHCELSWGEEWGGGGCKSAWTPETLT